MHASKTPIAMMTAHDFPSGLVADEGGMDMILVGDSLAMVALGMKVCYSQIITRAVLLFFQPELIVYCAGYEPS